MQQFLYVKQLGCIYKSHETIFRLETNQLNRI